MSRWEMLSKTTSSGKTLFRCRSCGRISPTPDKRCQGQCSEPKERYIVLPNNKYTGDLDVRGPYSSEKARDDEAQMFLFCDRADTHLYFLDIAPSGDPYTWKPSEAYIDDLKRKWDAVTTDDQEVEL